MSFDTGFCFFMCGVVFIVVFSVVASCERWTYDCSSLLCKILALLASFVSLVCICVVPSSAMYATWIIGNSKITELFIAVFLSIVLVGIWSWATGMKKRFPKVIYVSFIVIYIVLTFIGTIWERNYIKYESNIEYVTRKEEEPYKDRKLLYFYGIPADEVSEEVVKEIASSDGKIQASYDEVPYWYWAKSNEGKFKTCPAKDARIVFIDEDEEPRVVITIEHELKVKIDHNTEGVEVDEEVVEDKTKKIYHFHLHKSTTKHHLW